MTNEQVLEKQVETLEKLLQLKQAVIEELEAKIQRLTPSITIGGSGTVNIPSAWTYPSVFHCHDGFPHQFPSMWGGLTSPSCSRCGFNSNVYIGGATSSVITSTGPTDTFTCVGASTTIAQQAQATCAGQPVLTSAFLSGSCQVALNNTSENVASNVISLSSATKQ